MNKTELIKQIEEIINLDGDEYTDGEVLDLISDLINREKE